MSPLAIPYLQMLELCSVWRPFGVFSQAVRHNCPWHRSNFQQSYFPFYARVKLKKGSAEARLTTRGGRLLLMRRVLREQPFLAWNNEHRESQRPLSYPL